MTFRPKTLYTLSTIYNTTTDDSLVFFGLKLFFKSRRNEISSQPRTELKLSTGKSKVTDAWDWATLKSVKVDRVRSVDPCLGMNSRYFNLKILNEIQVQFGWRGLEDIPRQNPFDSWFVSN